MFAVSTLGDPTGVLYFLGKGENINQQTRTGQTPLHFAAQNTHLSVVRLLLEKGADPTIVDKDNMNPLDFVLNTGFIVHEQTPNGDDDAQEIISLLSMCIDNTIKEPE